MRGGHNIFCPNFLIFARKGEYVLGNAFLPHIWGGGGGKESSSFGVIEYGTPQRGRVSVGGGIPRIPLPRLGLFGNLGTKNQVLGPGGGGGYSDVVWTGVRG